MKEVAPNVYCVDVHYPTASRTCVYLIQQNNKFLMIDCGTALSVHYIEKTLQELNASLADLEIILLTHVHLDHSSGSGTIMQKNDSVKLWAHPRGSRHLIDPSRLLKAAFDVYQKPIKEMVGEVIPCPASRVFKAEDKQIIDFYGKKLQIIFSPGHAKHHFSVFDLEQKIYFAGDNAGASYRQWDSNGDVFGFPPTSANQFDPQAWYDSLQDIKKLNPSKICLTHFGELTQVESLVLQLEKWLEKCVAIAEKNKAKTDRANKIFNDLQDEIASELMARKPSWKKEDIADWMAGDVHIATVGLDVWLNQN